MKIFTFTKLRRTLLMLTAVIALVLTGCGGNKDTSSVEKSGQGAVSKKVNTFTDDRDGREYKTVKIGNQKWMAENLRFNVGDSWCFGNEIMLCQFGRLYDWNMAKIACPKGWHLPSDDEWKEMITVIGPKTGGKKLKSTSVWEGNGRGTDDFGFSALPVGVRLVTGEFAGGLSVWWTADAAWGGSASAISIILDEADSVSKTNVFDKRMGITVRCVADN